MQSESWQIGAANNRDNRFSSSFSAAEFEEGLLTVVPVTRQSFTPKMAATPDLDSFNAFDGWELEEKLNHARRILGKPARSGLPNSFAPPREQIYRKKRISAWVLTRFAVTGITCGGILLAWWWIFGRRDLTVPAAAALALGHLAWLAAWFVGPAMAACDHQEFAAATPRGGIPAAGCRFPGSCA